MSHQDRKQQTKTKPKQTQKGKSQPQANPRTNSSGQRPQLQTSGASGGDLPLLNSVYLGRALQWIFARVDWSSVGFRDDCSWTPRLLAAGALLWAWSDEGHLGERFFAARRLVEQIYPSEPEKGTLATSYQAFIKLLERWTTVLMAL